jgi:DhnA family fructose-bisphosphate aldolase class Ia
MLVFVGPQKTSEKLERVGEIAGDCDRLGMPLMAIMYPEGLRITSMFIR